MVDPLAEMFESVSPYNYAANNPIIFVDPDGKKIKLGDNYQGGIENIAKIAATRMGGAILNHLIQKNEVYTMNSTFLSYSSNYEHKTREINYVANPWRSKVDGGILTSMTAMGHETFHAFDHSNGLFSSESHSSVLNILEPRAVSFENYLRDSHSLYPLRQGYGEMEGNFNQFESSEKISDFTSLGNNKDKTSYGFSYTKTTALGHTTLLGKKTPNWSKTSASTHYMIIRMDEDKNITFDIYDDEDEYKKATNGW